MSGAKDSHNSEGLLIHFKDPSEVQSAEVYHHLFRRGKKKSPGAQPDCSLISIASHRQLYAVFVWKARAGTVPEERVFSQSPSLTFSCRNPYHVLLTPIQVPHSPRRKQTAGSSPLPHPLAPRVGAGDLCPCPTGAPGATSLPVEVTLHLAFLLPAVGEVLGPPGGSLRGLFEFFSPCWVLQQHHTGPYSTMPASPWESQASFIHSALPMLRLSQGYLRAIQIPRATCPLAALFRC